MVMLEEKSWRFSKVLWLLMKPPQKILFVCLFFFSLFFISTNKFLLLNFATVVFFSLQAYLDLRKCMYSVPLCSYASFQRQRVVIIL